MKVKRRTINLEKHYFNIYISKLTKNLAKQIEYIIKQKTIYEKELQGDIPINFIAEERKSEVERIAIGKINHLEELNAIKEGLKLIDIEYRDYVLDHIVNGKKYKDMVGISEQTAKFKTRELKFYVAIELGQIKVPVEYIRMLEKRKIP